MEKNIHDIIYIFIYQIFFFRCDAIQPKWRRINDVLILFGCCCTQASEYVLISFSQRLIKNTLRKLQRFFLLYMQQYESPSFISLTSSYGCCTVNMRAYRIKKNWEVISGRIDCALNISTTIHVICHKNMWIKLKQTPRYFLYSFSSS